MDTAVKERFLEYLRENSTRTRSGCLVPDSSKNDMEYGRVWFDKNQWRTHRLVFFLAHGWVSPIVHHVCEVPACIEEIHLEPLADEYEHHKRHGRAVLTGDKNPIRQARILAGMTLAQASIEAGVHLQAFFLQEQGVYPDLLPAVQAWLGVHEYSLPEALEGYHAYQRGKRRANGERLGLSILELGPPLGNPVLELRGQLGLARMGLAKEFCVHPGTLYRCETGISRSLPGQLRDALRDGGMSEDVLNDLAYRMEEVG